MKQSAQFAVCPARALDDTRMTPAAINVLLNIARYADRQGYAHPSLATLGQRIGVSRQAVQRQVKMLAGWGYIAIENRSRGNGASSSNRYRIMMDGILPKDFDRGEIQEEDVNTTLTPMLQGGQPPDVAPTTLNTTLEESPSIPQGGSEGELFGKSQVTNQNYQSAQAGTNATKRGALDALEREKEFLPFWELYPQRDGNDPRKGAYLAFCRARMHGHAVEAIMAGLRSDLRLWTADQKIGTRYIPMAQTWLNGARWVAKAGSGKVEEKKRILLRVVQFSVARTELEKANLSTAPMSVRIEYLESIGIDRRSLY